MTESLIDTDILSFYFKGEQQVVKKFNDYLNKFDVINISIITYYEILGGLKFKKAERQITEFEDFVANNTIIHISEESVKIAADIYANLRLQGITIGTSDILIAGIAIENDLRLITNNEKHFESINGLDRELEKVKITTFNVGITCLFCC
ncbi:MAG: type II toxin-antitoxin system VapC family toxin [Cyclobacteriaceae bacterium]|nr:type II toxin-antitoxin system VapC family toxin [Cyclobacteriaceae bacterium]